MTRKNRGTIISTARKTNSTMALPSWAAPSPPLNRLSRVRSGVSNRRHLHATAIIGAATSLAPCTPRPPCTPWAQCRSLALRKGAGLHRQDAVRSERAQGRQWCLDANLKTWIPSSVVVVAVMLCAYRSARLALTS